MRPGRRTSLISFVTMPGTARRLRRVAHRRFDGNVSLIMRRLVKNFLQEDRAQEIERAAQVGPRQGLWDYLAVRYGFKPLVPPPPPYSCELSGCLHPERNCEIEGCMP